MSFTIEAKMSATQLDTLATCRLKWWFAHAKGYKPIARNVAFDLGTGLHLALAGFYKSRKDPVAVFEKWIDKEIRAVYALMETGDDLIAQAMENDVESLQDNLVMGRYMLEQYLIRYQHERLEILQVEKEVFKSIPGTDWDFHAVIDMLVRDGHRRNKVYVMDHKSFTRFYLAYLEKDHQFTSYAWAAADLIDEPVAGVLYNGLRKQNPGSTSKLDLFERHTLDINGHQVKLFLKRLRDVHRLLTQGKFCVYPEPSPISCGYCQFRDPCTLYMKGEDYGFLLDNLYTKKSEREYDEG